jgi:NitT/TauT family transport system substrate-binding protein
VAALRRAGHKCCKIKREQGGSMRRHAAVAMLILAASAIASTNVARAQSGALKTVTRGTVSTTGAEWPDMVASDKGFYEKEGLKVEHVILSPTTITPSLIGGSMEFGFINAAQLMQAVETGADLIAIGQGMDPAPYVLVGGKTIKSLKDLKGKTIALAEQYDAYAEVTREILAKAGLDPEKDVNFRYGGNSNQRVAALMAGAIDAVPLPAPNDKLALDQGFNALATYSDYYPKLALSLTAVVRKWAEANPETVKAYLRAQKNAITWLNDPKNKDEAIAILQKGTAGTLSSASYTYDVLIDKLHMFPPSGCIQPEGMKTLVEVLSRVTPKVKKDTPVSKYISTTYCPS